MAATDLITIEEAKPWVGDPDDTDHDALIGKIITQSSGLIRNYLKRPELITTATLTEYHTFDESDAELYTLDFPILTVTSIHEDTARTYADASELTVNTHFIINKPAGKIIRTVSATAGRTAWATGFRAVKVVYTAGYADTAGVPDAIKDVCGRHVGTVYKEITKQLGGIENVSDDFSIVW